MIFIAAMQILITHLENKSRPISSYRSANNTRNLTSNLNPVNPDKQTLMFRPLSLRLRPRNSQILQRRKPRLHSLKNLLLGRKYTLRFTPLKPGNVNFVTRLSSTTHTKQGI